MELTSLSSEEIWRLGQKVGPVEWMNRVTELSSLVGILQGATLFQDWDESLLYLSRVPTAEGKVI